MVIISITLILLVIGVGVILPVYFFTTGFSDPIVVWRIVVGIFIILIDITTMCTLGDNEEW
jgi:hypothetical protein